MAQSKVIAYKNETGETKNLFEIGEMQEYRYGTYDSCTALLQHLEHYVHGWMNMTN